MWDINRTSQCQVRKGTKLKSYNVTAGPAPLYGSGTGLRRTSELLTFKQWK